MMCWPTQEVGINKTQAISVVSITRATRQVVSTKALAYRIPLPKVWPRTLNRRPMAKPSSTWLWGWGPCLALLIDLLPTLATLAHIPNRPQWTFLGRDLTPLLTDPTTSVQDALLFTFDDQNAGAKNGQTVVTQPNHIRCLREQEWKYALYC